jgi:hypothetical protein
LNSQWILYEAGSISKSLNGNKARVCTYRLCNLRPEDIRPPLARFQGTKFEKEETRKLVKSISRAVGGALEEHQLDRLFDSMWLELESELLKIPAQTPMTEPPLRTEREMIAELLELSRANSGAVDRQVRELSHLITGLVHEEARLRTDNDVRSILQKTMNRSAFSPSLRDLLDATSDTDPATRARVDKELIKLLSIRPDAEDPGDDEQPPKRPDKDGKDK